MIELVIPANREMMMIVRLTAAGVFSKYRLDIDALDDAKMAVEEACLTLIRYAGRERIRIVFSAGEDHVECSFYAEGAANLNVMAPDEKEMEVLKAILSSLADDAEMEYDNAFVQRIRITKKLPA